MLANTAMPIFMMGKERMLVPDTIALINQFPNGLCPKAPAYEIEGVSRMTRKGVQMVWESILENSSISNVSLSLKCLNRDWILNSEEVKEYRIITKPYDRKYVKALLIED